MYILHLKNFLYAVGLVLFTDGVAGFSSPQSQYSSVNQLRTANISCWVVLCGGGASHSHAPGMIPDTETLGFMTHACNGCLIDPDKASGDAAVNYIS